MSRFNADDHDYPAESTSTIRTVNGVYVDLLHPEPEMIRLGDIAAALANTCRFGGHLPAPYSVGEHSLHVAAMLNRQFGDNRLSLCGLLHDATEAYLGDVVRPLKRNLPGYRELEDRMAVVIGRRFGLDGAWWDDDRIHAADNELLAWEMATVRDCAFRQPSTPFAVAAAFQSAAYQWGSFRRDPSIRRTVQP